MTPPRLRTPLVAASSARRLPAVVGAAVVLLTVSAPEAGARSSRDDAPFAASTLDAGTTEPVQCPDCWQPPPSTTWQYQLQGRIDPNVTADAYVIAPSTRRRPWSMTCTHEANAQSAT